MAWLQRKLFITEALFLKDKQSLDRVEIQVCHIGITPSNNKRKENELSLSLTILQLMGRQAIKQTITRQHVECYNEDKQWNSCILIRYTTVLVNWVFGGIFKNLICVVLVNFHTVNISTMADFKPPVIWHLFTRFLNILLCEPTQMCSAPLLREITQSWWPSKLSRRVISNWGMNKE